MWAVREAKRRLEARRSLEDFARSKLWIQTVDPQSNRKIEQRFILKPAQQDYIANQTDRDLILKARQLGFSTLIQADFLRLAITRSVGTLTLSHDDDSTQRLRRMAEFFYHRLPDPKPRRKYANASVTTYTDTQSEAAISTAGSKSAGRSFTLTHLHGSECAFWPDAETVITGAMQAGNPAVKLESTANGAQGWFYERCMETLDGHPGWRLHFYPWWWEPDYRIELGPDEASSFILDGDELGLVEKHGLDAGQILWRRAKQRELRHLFPQEYPEDPRSCFLLSGNSFFGVLDGVFSAPYGAVYDPTHEYCAGLDWGQSNDYTVLSIGDKTTKQQVVFLRLNKMPWADMRQRVIAECAKFHVNPLIPEENSASSNVEDLSRGYPHVVAFRTTNDSKTRGINALYEAIHTGGWKLLPDPDQRREFAIFQARQTTLGTWTYSAPGKEHDDTVIAAMLMIHGASRPRLRPGFILE